MESHAEHPVLLSVLDRLLDDGEVAATAGRAARGRNMRLLRRSVQRDLETLLNTRRRCESWPDEMTELSASVFDFGIPDFTSANLATAARRERFRKAVEDVIRRFEPRFKTVKVVLRDNSETEDRTIRFRIEALMYADPAPEAVVFDSYVEPVSRSVAVQGDDG